MIGKDAIKTCETCGESLPYFSNWNRRFCSSCGIERSAAARRRARKPGQLEAHAEVSKAINKGLIPFPSERSCVDCGAKATEYDHRDYRYPLMIDPVCHRCNILRGPAISADEHAALVNEQSPVRSVGGRS